MNRYDTSSVSPGLIDREASLLTLDHHIHASTTFTDQMNTLCGRIDRTYTGFPDR
mgnify:CR=1 FL=1